jgi:hypothetical protein
MTLSQHSKRRLRSDLGTVVAHVGIIAALATAAATGFAIAGDAPARRWLSTLGTLLPQGDVWTLHILAGLVTAVTVVFHVVYLSRAGLGRRMRFDRVRLRAIARSGPARWHSANVALAWALLLALAVQIVTGGLLYIGYGAALVTAHFWSAVAIVSFPVAHILCHAAAGGARQVTRIMHPAKLARAAPEPTLAELVAEHFATERMNHPSPSSRARPPGQTLHVHPISVAAAVAVSTAAVLAGLDVAGRDRLVIPRIERGNAPRLDADLADHVWRRAPVVTVETNQGANFAGTGASSVTIRAVHDGEWAYFAFSWTDPTRSLKHLPLVKQADGWRVAQTHYDIEDENAFYEDKFSVMLSADSTRPAGGSIQLGSRPLADKPQPYSGRGLHFTTDGSIVDVWHWKASRGGLLGWMDDNYFGPPAAPTAPEVAGKSRYKAGYATDPGKATYANNFDHEPRGGYRGLVKPKRLPKDVAIMQNAMGTLDLDPDASNSEGARWWMTDEESVPYAADLDGRIPVGTIIPGVLIAGAYSGDRADVRCAARWSAGRWVLELARKLDTGSKHDIPIRSGVSLWVAAFDHAQTRHTRHLRPITIEVQQ